MEVGYSDQFIPRSQARKKQIVVPEKRKPVSKTRVVIAIVVVVVCAIIAAVGVVVGLGGGTSVDPGTPLSVTADDVGLGGETSVDSGTPCDAGGFQPVEYAVVGDDGKPWKRTVWLKFDRNEAEYWYFYHSRSVQHCLGLDAELWDVRDGEEEWNAVVDFARAGYQEILDYGVWIDGKVNATCDAPVAECTARALAGHGLPITWPTPHSTNFSRLGFKVRGYECVYFDSKDALIWKSVDCSNTSAWTLCVRRGCVSDRTGSGGDENRK